MGRSLAAVRQGARVPSTMASYLLSGTADRIYVYIQVYAHLFVMTEKQVDTSKSSAYRLGFRPRSVRLRSRGLAFASRRLFRRVAFLGLRPAYSGARTLGVACSRQSSTGTLNRSGSGGCCETAGRRGSLLEAASLPLARTARTEMVWFYHSTTITGDHS